MKLCISYTPKDRIPSFLPPSQRTAPFVFPQKNTNDHSSRLRTRKGNEETSLKKKDLHIQDINNWKPRNSGWMWERKNGHGRFSREAIDANGWRGKLCMVNVRGDTAKEGATYDVEKDAWEEIPEGMLAGWRGLVATMNGEVMYASNEAKGALRKYVPERDFSDNILESERLRGAHQMAARGGRVCIVCGSDDGIVVVDVVASLRRYWVVDVLAGFEVVAVHILSRMNWLSFNFSLLDSTSPE